MYKRPFFSIVMPVYNAANYLEKAVDSVLEQTYADFELLLIDDCSVDGSAEICKKIASLDARVIVLTTSNNSGASAARNLALKKARGKYLGFVDSDDTIDLNLLEKAFEVLESGRYDCLKFGCKEEYYSAKGLLKYTKICTLPESEFIEGLKLNDEIVAMEMVPLFGYACNGFYSKAITAMHGIFFNENLNVNEDFDFNIRFFRYVKRMKFIDYPAYHYSKRCSGSLTSQDKNYTYEAQMMKIRSLIDLYSNMDEISTASKQKIFWMYTRFIYAVLIRAKRKNDIEDVIQKICSDSLYKMFCEIEVKSLTVKQKIMMEALKNIRSAPFSFLIEVVYITKKYFPVIFSIMKK